MSVYLSEDVNLQGISSFAKDVLSDRSLRERFYSSPEQVLSEYGITEYDKNSPQIQMVLASCDPDVIEMINAHDLRGYLHVLADKHYLQTDLVELMTQALDDGVGTKSQSEYGCLILAAALVGAVVLVFAGVFVYVTILTDVVVSNASEQDVTNVSEDALQLYIDESKDLGTAEIDEKAYISKIRYAINKFALTGNKEKLNTIFKLGCGTAEYALNDNN